MTQALTSGISGLVIAEVIPAAMAIGRNAALMPSRFGSPKLTFEAPQVVLTLSSSRSRRTSCEHLLAGLAERPDRHDQRVDDDVRARDAVVGGALDDPLGDREPDVGVHRRCPVSSLLIATTAAPYLRTSGRTRSRRSSSPVTELSSGLPW